MKCQMRGYVCGACDCCKDKSKPCSVRDAFVQDTFIAGSVKCNNHCSDVAQQHENT
jgi:hypothetical protein